MGYNNTNRFVCLAFARSPKKTQDNKTTSQNHSYETIPTMKLRINKLLFPQVYVSNQKQRNLKHHGFASKSDQ